MAIDLSALEVFDNPAATPVATAPGAQASGEPLQIPVGDIDEDPGQPRQSFDKAKLDELAASIKEHGVIQPITVIPNPDKPGRWRLRYGARRWRASKLAGLKEIPAFVGEALDEYAQVIENLQRDDLTALELAVFIKKRVEEGDSKNKIAKRLAKPNSFVSEHLALVDMPPAIAAAYDEGKAKSARAVYDLRTLHDKNPERVEAWLAEQEEVTVSAVGELAAEIKGKSKKQKDGQDGGEGGAGAGNFVHTKSEDGGTDGGGGENEGGKQSSPKPVKLPPGPDDGAGDGASTKSKQTDPDAISRPLLIVEFDGRAAYVLLNRRPSSAGLIRIKYEDGGGEDEVNAGQCKINRLMDGSP